MRSVLFEIGGEIRIRKEAPSRWNGVADSPENKQVRQIPKQGATFLLSMQLYTHDPAPLHELTLSTI
jgi:hypothetical protein